MYADDLVVWLMTMCEHANSSCPIYNVGSDEAISLFDLGLIMGDLFGVEVIFQPITSNNVDRYTPSTIKAKINLNLDLKNDLIQSIFKATNKC